MILTVTHSFSVPVQAKQEKKENVIFSSLIPLAKKVEKTTKFHLGRDYMKRMKGLESYQDLDNEHYYLLLWCNTNLSWETRNF